VKINLTKIKKQKGGNTMKNKLTKVISASLVATMVVGSIAGCGNKAKDATTAKATAAAGGTTAAKTDSKKFAKQVEIEIPVYDRGTQGQAPVDDNYWTKWVQKEFGDKNNVKVTYVAIPRTDEVNKFNMLLASKTAPDIIFHYDYPAAVSYYGMGALQDINLDTLKEYAPTFYKNSVDSKVLDYGKLDGKQVFIPARRPDAYNFATVMRQDWLDKAGVKMPTNVTEYENALRKFKEMKLGGANTIPSTLFELTGYVTNYAYRQYPLPEKDLALYSDLTVASLTWEPTKKLLQWYNKLYNEGLISPEWALDKDGSKARADFMAGTAGTYSAYISQTPTVFQTLKENVPDSKVAILNSTATLPEGTKPAGRAYWPFGMINGINSASSPDEVKATYMFLEWMSQPENLFTLQNGIEGKTYTKDADGLPVIVDYKGEERLNTNSNKDMYCLVIEGKDYGTEEKNLKVQTTTFAPKGFEFLINDNYKQIKNDLQYQYPDFLFNKAIKSVADNKATLLDKWHVYSAQLIMCKPADFDALYEKASKDYLSSGYQAVLDERLSAYNAMKK
jgi:putative aldouronate transport system substrate-binding protein